MNETRPLSPASPVEGLNAQIGIIGQRQEHLAQVVAELGGSVSDFDQLRTYVEQIASILTNLAKEVAAHDLEGVERRLEEFGRTSIEIDDLRRETDELARVVGELASRREAVPALWWPDLPPGPARAEAVQGLGGWVDEVLRARHPEAYSELGTCWFQHPDILDELTALQAAWFAAYRDPAAPPTAAIEWHDRWLPGAMARCKAVMSIRGCKARHAKQPDSTAGFLDRQEFKNFARCGPEQVIPLAEESSPPWGPVAEESSPPWGPVAEEFPPPSGPAAEPSSALPPFPLPREALVDPLGEEPGEEQGELPGAEPAEQPGRP